MIEIHHLNAPVFLTKNVSRILLNFITIYDAHSHKQILALQTYGAHTSPQYDHTDMQVKRSNKFSTGQL